MKIDYKLIVNTNMYYSSININECCLNSTSNFIVFDNSFMKTFKTYFKNPIHTYISFQAFEALQNCIKKDHTYKQKVKEYVPIFF